MVRMLLFPEQRSLPLAGVRMDAKTSGKFSGEGLGVARA